ncbi:aminotransferase class I/II-fold pyridoxal phosphate-dependent enzyme [Pedobacter cryophilus]|uniref:Aminotransferase class I/II-fold pyridoxal phosphate-dependent enzyme n=1 Tax=Pedobacter cryophilus TaxID=2571271 RepID=A0A4U1C5K8_9SPHI|nr:aminotransferase class I/II-fold pyridoxal phosphate-dependent enzyme [Pedobacter cryophilus]TKC00642.1 aminotransferase class I/II-fold pyridoxal phosphate-dependent enzyme [Pedobacter cryophilus]
MKPVIIQSGYQPKVNVDKEKHLFFGGTSYLGLNYHPKILKIFCNGLKIWGLNNGASRNNNIQLSIYNEAEKALAKDYQTEVAVTFSSGWLAAQVAVEVLSKNRDCVYINEAHPALNAHNNAVLEIQTAVNYINLSHHTNFLMVSNSLNNVMPQIFDFSALSQILPSKNVVLLLDHSHGFGILKDEWLLTIKKINANIDVVICGSLAKGLSLDAGVVLGSNHWISQIKLSSTFNGASPCSAASLHTYMNSESIRNKALAKLTANLNYLFSKLSKDNFYWIPNFPVVVIKNQALVEKLITNKVLFTSFPYPNANSPTINRLVITSAHSQKNLKKLMAILKN